MGTWLALENPGLMVGRLTLRTLGALLLVGCVLTAPSRAGTPAVPSFGVDLGVVNLSLSVTDPREHYVSDLTEQDFVVFEDGVRQNICLFTRDRLPISLTLLLDGSSSMKTSLRFAQSAAVRFIRTLQATDDAQVAQFTRRYTVLQEATSDKALLEAAVARVEAAGETSLYESLYVALKDLRHRRQDQATRRQAMIVLTDGEDTSSLVSEDQLMDLARRAEVAIYAIGLFGPRPSAMMTGPSPTHFLTALSRETGGRAYFPKELTDLEGIYDRIADELRTLYGVGYVSANTRRDGAWRRIAVETIRENLIVRHRLGYHAPLAPTTPAAGH
jgi:Ca-activated chloride channel homolog